MEDDDFIKKMAGVKPINKGSKKTNNNKNLININAKKNKTKLQKEKISSLDNNIKKISEFTLTFGEVNKDLKRGKIRIDRRVDLHGYNLADAHEKFKTENKKYLSKLTINHIDLGKVRRWGFPLSYVKSNNFQDYTDYIWKRSEKPKLVLVDGRFRVCCFLTSLKFADPGTKIIFDDYVNRPHYHFVEKYVSRMNECSRQCLFVVPSKNSIDMDALNKDIDFFRFVMD